MSESISLTPHASQNTWQKNLRSVLRTILSYLGIAVLVALLMVLSVPTVGERLAMMNQIVLIALKDEVPGLADTVQAIDPATVSPQVSPVDVEHLPAKPLENLKDDSVSDQESQDAAVEPVTSLKSQVEQAMAHFSLTRKQLDALETYIARKYKVGRDVIHRLTDTVLVAGYERKIHPLLTFAVMSVESRFNPYAESGAGAQGLMQVMTRVHTDKFERLGQTEDAAFHPMHNIRVGIEILADCIKKRGSVTNGLKCYVGATGPNDGGYANKVLAEQRRMALSGKIALPN